MTVFEKVAASPEMLGVLLDSLTVIGSPWEEEFIRRSAPPATRLIAEPAHMRRSGTIRRSGRTGSQGASQGQRSHQRIICGCLSEQLKVKARWVKC